jgi:hypothetical protein
MGKNPSRFGTGGRIRRRAMERDMDLIRDILLDLESNEDAYLEEVMDKGYEREIVLRHMELLHEAGLVEAKFSQAPEKGYFIADVARLTWEGYEFLDNARNERLWQKVTGFVAEKGVTVSFTVLQSLRLQAVELALDTL